MEELTLFGWKLGAFFTGELLAATLRVAILFLIGLPAISFLSRTLRRYITNRYSPQRGLIVGKVVFYTGFGIIAASILREMGFSLAPLLGAAGIIGVAVGFASQTSLSNIISGIFLIAEQPFVVNDLITVGDTTGLVLSIDILSVKLRTFDNKFIRIPNETIVKTQVTNITRFPIRRVDVNVGVAYKEDIGRVREVLLEIAHENPLCLQEPEPLVIFTGFGDSSINFLFAVWGARMDFLALKNNIQDEIKQRFDEEGIEIPFPHRTVYTGSVTEPFPVQVVESSDIGTGEHTA